MRTDLPVLPKTRLVLDSAVLTRQAPADSEPASWKHQGLPAAQVWEPGAREELDGRKGRTSAGAGLLPPAPEEGRACRAWAGEGVAARQQHGPAPPPTAARDGAAAQGGAEGGTHADLSVPLGGKRDDFLIHRRNWNKLSAWQRCTESSASPWKPNCPRSGRKGMWAERYSRFVRPSFCCRALWTFSLW